MFSATTVPENVMSESVFQTCCPVNDVLAAFELKLPEQNIVKNRVKMTVCIILAVVNVPLSQSADHVNRPDHLEHTLKMFFYSQVLQTS